ncbi:hypothetical protein [Chryseobacterium sediminis]|uniref:hypothetical protein n=1 Tax=Chryseobacterium sediminis TaxID=1679494 RepID=UPI002859BA2D|nr:hypothetical protein [Chryseobacterium sediminis]MDR6461601.1 hypothetical protein [Chryseobacterium sediminis]
MVTLISCNEFSIAADGKDDENIICINQSKNSFTEFYSTFYHQLKDPSEFSFFKVMEYEAKQTALNLRKYIDEAPNGVKQELKKYEISIDVVEVHRMAGEENILSGLSSG